MTGSPFASVSCHAARSTRSCRNECVALGLRTVDGVIDEHRAREAAEAKIASLSAPRSEDEAFVIWQVEEHPRAWVLYFNTRRWVRTRDMRDMAVGSCPFVVDKATGEIHLYGSGQYKQFRAWLD